MNMELLKPMIVVKIALISLLVWVGVKAIMPSMFGQSHPKDAVN